MKCRPTSRGSAGNGSHNSGGIQAGIADDQARDFDFEKTEMKYDSTGMFHWSPARSLEDCILVIFLVYACMQNKIKIGFKLMFISVLLNTRIAIKRR